MSDDFFGGILDSIRGSGNDIASFLGTDVSGLGDALSSGIGNAYKNNKNDVAAFQQANKLSEYGQVPMRQEYKPTSDRVGPAKSEDFAAVESQWLRRIQRFAQMDTASANKVNEGVPR